jgi:hypothetical protein
MGEPHVKKPQKVVERNIELTSAVMAELLATPALLDKLPTGFRLVVLPDNDPDLWLFNLERLQREVASDEPVVFARVTATGKGLRYQTHFYAPLAA